jgi:hypothetical protein
MSEYQYYEFLAFDRPLDARQQDEVRALSTRARSTPPASSTSTAMELSLGEEGLELRNFRPRRASSRWPIVVSPTES